MPLTAVSGGAAAMLAARALGASGVSPSGNGVSPSGSLGSGGPSPRMPMLKQVASASALGPQLGMPPPTAKPPPVAGEKRPASELSGSSVGSPSLAPPPWPTASAAAAAPSSSSAGKDPGQYVSIDDLVSEIEQCTPPDKMDLMRTLLQDLRQKNLTLKEFCKRVRMTMGEEVLRQTVGGLRRAQDNKKQRMEAASAAAAGGAQGGAVAAPPPMPTASSGVLFGAAAIAPPPVAAPEVKSETNAEGAAAAAASSSTGPAALPPILPDADAEKRRQEGLSAIAKSGALKTAVPKEEGSGRFQSGQKLLIHCLLCPKQTGCPLKECARMKSHLKKVQDHAESCQYSSMPGGQADCTTCRKWQDLKRIKEQWRRKLIEQYKLTQKDRPAPSAAAGGYGQAASVAVAPHLRGAVPMSAFGQPTVGGAPLHAAPSVSLPGRGRGEGGGRGRGRGRGGRGRGADPPGLQRRVSSGLDENQLLSMIDNELGKKDQRLGGGPPGGFINPMGMQGGGGWGGMGGGPSFNPLAGGGGWGGGTNFLERGEPSPASMPVRKGGRGGGKSKPPARTKRPREKAAAAGAYAKYADDYVDDDEGAASSSRASSPSSLTSGVELDEFGRSVRDEEAQGIIERTNSMVMLPGFGAQDENLDVGVNILFDTARQQPFRPPQWAQPQAHDAPLVCEPCGTLSNVGRVVETFPDGHCKVARVAASRKSFGSRRRAASRRRWRRRRRSARSGAARAGATSSSSRRSGRRRARRATA